MYASYSQLWCIQCGTRIEVLSDVQEGSLDPQDSCEYRQRSLRLRSRMLITVLGPGTCSMVSSVDRHVTLIDAASLTVFALQHERWSSHNIHVCFGIYIYSVMARQFGEVGVYTMVGLLSAPVRSQGQFSDRAVLQGFCRKLLPNTICQNIEN